jgi:hypothetical protein
MHGFLFVALALAASPAAPKNIPAGYREVCDGYGCYLIPANAPEPPPRFMATAASNDAGPPVILAVSIGAFQHICSPGPIEPPALPPPAPPSDLPPPPNPAKPSPPIRMGYPVHSGMIYNFEGSWNPPREFMIQHLLSAPEHAGEFDSGWLHSLSFQELYSLHDDDHLHRVKTPRPTAAPTRAAPPRAAPTIQYAAGPCPGGVCPVPAGMTRRQARQAARAG